MFAIIIDENKYLQSYSDKYRMPESIIVNSIPNEDDMEKMKCYQYIDNNFVFDKEKWKEIEASRAESARILDAQQQIRDLKEMLTASDYQIIKCYEYSLNNLELPLDNL